MAWGLRYALFAAGRLLPLIVLGIALHGICFDFFFAAGFIQVENTAPEAIRASGQSLFGVLTYGLGQVTKAEELARLLACPVRWRRHVALSVSAVVLRLSGIPFS